jgi:hypothetical protein
MLIELRQIAGKRMGLWKKHKTNYILDIFASWKVAILIFGPTDSIVNLPLTSLTSHIIEKIPIKSPFPSIRYWPFNIQFQINGPYLSLDPIFLVSVAGDDMPYCQAYSPSTEAPRAAQGTDLNHFYDASLS